MSSATAKKTIMFLSSMFLTPEHHVRRVIKMVYHLGRTFVAGHRGMVGKATCRRLIEEDIDVVTYNDDLRDIHKVNKFFRLEKPDTVVFAAARVGGIAANNSYPVQFLSDNASMALASINAAFKHNVKRFLFLGSTCIYPRDCPQPMKEESLLTGPLEKTNEAYALAKIMGLKLCEYYRRVHDVVFHTIMPTNLYGPGDNYHLEHSHVLPALMRKFHEAKVQGLNFVTIWGTGMPRREFLHVDDLADAIVHLLKIDSPPDRINVGTGVDITIYQLAQLMAKVVGFNGRIDNDPFKPDGAPVKCCDVSLLNSMGWEHRIDLEDGLKRTYDCFLSDLKAGSLRCV